MLAVPAARPPCTWPAPMATGRPSMRCSLPVQAGLVLNGGRLRAISKNRSQIPPPCLPERKEKREERREDRQEIRDKKQDRRDTRAKRRDKRQERRENRETEHARSRRGGGLVCLRGLNPPPCPRFHDLLRIVPSLQVSTWLVSARARRRWMPWWKARPARTTPSTGPSYWRAV